LWTAEVGIGTGKASGPGENRNRRLRTLEGFVILQASISSSSESNVPTGSSVRLDLLGRPRGGGGFRVAPVLGFFPMLRQTSFGPGVGKAAAASERGREGGDGGGGGVGRGTARGGTRVVYALWLLG
jgi:hypothetical protein